jgi:branched-chain amino acid transport system substrate-binding protein
MASISMQIRYALASLIIGSLLVACGEPSAPIKPVRLGVIVDSSGASASLGIAGRNGVQLAIEQHNARGGILGRPIEMLLQDDGFDPQRARQAAKRLIDNQVDAVLGPMTSVIAEVLAEPFTEANILLMGITPLSPLLAGKDDMFFRTLGHQNPDARAIATHLRQHLDIRQVGLLVEQSNAIFTTPWVTDFTDHFAALGGQVVKQVNFQRSPEAQYAELADSVLVPGLAAVVIVSSALDTAMLASQLRQKQPGIVLATPAWAAADALLEMGGQAVEGLITAQVFDLNDESQYFKAFRGEYQARFSQDVDTAAVTGYNATQVLLKAIAARQPNEHLKQTLLRIRRFEGLQQPIVFDEFGDSSNRIYLRVVSHGRFIDPE